MRICLFLLIILSVFKAKLLGAYKFKIAEATSWNQPFIIIKYSCLSWVMLFVPKAT